MRDAKAPLFRKVNTRARGVKHDMGGDYRDERRSRASRTSDASRASMHGGRRRGLDYTPLFRFLISRVGSPWAEVYAEAAARLDRPDPIFWLVARQPHERRAVVRLGESSWFGGLCIDDAGRLQRVAPELGPSSLEPTCGCCTHTFDGKPFTRRFTAPGDVAAPAAAAVPPAD